MLTSKHWIALILLFVGVVSAQIDPSNSLKAAETIASGGRKESPFFGMVCVVTACILSGFSGVFFELVLKSTSKTIVMRNIQLSIYGIVAGIVQAFVQDREVIHTHGFFFGYDGWVWVVILIQSLGGLLVAAVVRYADNILKTFATSVAIVLTLITSVLLFDTPLTAHLVIGNILVVVATAMYGLLPPPAAVKPLMVLDVDRRNGSSNDNPVSNLILENNNKPA